VDEVAGREALAGWVERMRSLGYGGIRAAYFSGVKQEFFDYLGSTYEVTTEAAWDDKSGGDLRVFIELSDVSDPNARVVLEKDVIVAPDGSVFGE
jgi:hypothetical protein